MTGLAAYKTYLGMGLHFRGNLDGWQYNFTGKCKQETFEKNKRVMYMYAKVEEDYPTKVEQIKYLYPAFKAMGYFKPDALMLVRREYVHFMKIFGEDLTQRHQAWLTELLAEGFIKDFADLFDTSEMLPKLYQLYSNKVMTYDAAVILCIVIPELLNTIVSQEPIVFETWKAKLQFDIKFVQLYISQPVLKQLRDATVVAFQTK